MKFKKERYKSRIDRLKKWHRWFSWHPVRIEGNIHFLEFVERRMVFLEFANKPWQFFDIEYRGINNEKNRN